MTDIPYHEINNGIDSNDATTINQITNQFIQPESSPYNYEPNDIMNDNDFRPNYSTMMTNDMDVHQFDTSNNFDGSSLSGPQNIENSEWQGMASVEAPSGSGGDPNNNNQQISESELQSIDNNNFQYDDYLQASNSDDLEPLGNNSLEEQSNMLSNTPTDGQVESITIENDNNNFSEVDASVMIGSDEDNKVPDGNAIEIQINTASQNQTDNTSEVIDLLDDDNDDNDSDDDIIVELQYDPQIRKRPKLDNAIAPDNLSSQSNNLNAAVSSYRSRNDNMPNWVPSANQNAALPVQVTSQVPVVPVSQNQLQFDLPNYIIYPAGFRSTWNNLAPSLQPTTTPSATSSNPGQAKRSYKLSLLNINEFTITGLSSSWNSAPTSVMGLRVPIKKISREHGKAYFERDKEEEGGGKWRIPLGAYHAFVAYLKSDPNTFVEPIPQRLLQMASLEKARETKGYPEAKELIDKNVPEGLANALAPFQRGGVDFVLSKHGRALIADDMGLGKTIQGVASMSAYHKEWPLLVLCPSGARYHWENEFQNWLGTKSLVNKDMSRSASKDALLRNSQIYVIPSSKSPVLPGPGVRVVICSYGLAPVLAESGKLYPRQFRCAIVDESHMLKNKQSKRTLSLLPVLQAMDRCVLLSGTPAFARPVELWPQLSILRVEREGWWDNEEDFMDKYVRKGGIQESAELNTMLRGTVMIRRLKNDILKTLPKKLREKAEVKLLDQKRKEEFNNLLAMLRQGTGQLGKIARQQYGEDSRTADSEPEDDEKPVDNDLAKIASTARERQLQRENDHALEKEYEIELRKLDRDTRNKFSEGKVRIQQQLETTENQLDNDQQHNVLLELEGNLRSELESEYLRRFNELQEEYKDFLSRKEGIPSDPYPTSQVETPPQEEKEEVKRVTVLSRLYALTGEAKVPLIVDMLKRWLADPTKGKLCIFAHHISVLDALEVQAGLSNARSSKTKFIRIDGSTLPKQRQEQINEFQTDPLVRIAILGITAAGVAVTLTASSTVWFAELFWTPAIMIQAEDRCHRIGQQARVKCMYIVAKGTLDDILWKLIEKKFRDLGEFVEGKEKLKLVVDKIYHGEKELYSIFTNGDEDASQDGLDDIDQDDFDSFLLGVELEHDIEQLGEEEQQMLLQSEASEDYEGEPDSEDSKVPAVEKFESSLGASEDAAIALSDDDSDVSETEGEWLDLRNNRVTRLDVPLLDCRCYKIVIGDSRLGVDVTLFHSRIVIKAISRSRLDRLGPHSKPSVGDVLVAVNGHRLALVTSLLPVMQYLQKLFQKPPVELSFVEIPSFITRFKEYLSESKNMTPGTSTSTNGRSTRQQGPATTGPDAVIDLADDD